MENKFFFVLATVVTLGTYGIWFALKQPSDPTDYNWLYGTLFFLIGTAFGTLFGPVTELIIGAISKPESAITGD